MSGRCISSEGLQRGAVGRERRRLRCPRFRPGLRWRLSWLRSYALISLTIRAASPDHYVVPREYSNRDFQLQVVVWVFNDGSFRLRVNVYRTFPRACNPPALADWCAGRAIKQPWKSVSAIYAPGVHDPYAKHRVRRCAARLATRPRPAPLVATNSSVVPSPLLDGSTRFLPTLDLQFTLVASVEPGYNSPSRVRASDSAFDGTPPPGNAATGFVQRPAIPPRPQLVASRSPLKTAAEYRAIVRCEPTTHR